MSCVRRSCLVLSSAALLVLSGCGTSGPASVRTPAPTNPTQTGTTGDTPTGATPSAPTSGATATTSAVACPTTGQAAIPDGTWNGPLSIAVDGPGGISSFGRTTGTGTLTLSVTNGQVTAGHWSVHWHSVGHVNAGQASATITLLGTLNGTALGSASHPVLPWAWAIRGTATITRPLQASVPVKESGRGTDVLTVVSTSCDRITGTFAPSFTSKDARATFSGTARWVAAPG